MIASSSGTDRLKTVGPNEPTGSGSTGGPAPVIEQDISMPDGGNQENRAAGAPATNMEPMCMCAIVSLTTDCSFNDTVM